MSAALLLGSAVGRGRRGPAAVRRPRGRRRRRARPGPAALEGSTFVPRLGEAPALRDDSTHAARASLAALVNGPTGSPDTRQGLNSALLGEGNPLNVLAWRPGQGRYSSLRDVDGRDLVEVLWALEISEATWNR